MIKLILWTIKFDITMQNALNPIGYFYKSTKIATV